MNHFLDTATRLDALEAGLAALKQKRIVAGNGIRATEFESYLLIEADEPEPCEEAAAPEIPRTVVAGEGVRVTDEGGVIRIELEDAIPAKLPPRPPEQYVPESFPFEVAATGARTVTMRGQNGEAGRYYVNCVFRGTGGVPIVVPEETFTVTEDCYLLLKVVPSGGGVNFSLTAHAELAAAIPVPADGLFVVPLAYIHCETDSLTVQQMHFGNVYIYDRII